MATADVGGDESLREFLASAKPTWTDKHLSAVTSKLCNAGFEKLPDLLTALRTGQGTRDLNQRIRETGAPAFTNETLQALRDERRNQLRKKTRANPRKVSNKAEFHANRDGLDLKLSADGHSDCSSVICDADRIADCGNAVDLEEKNQMPALEPAQCRLQRRGKIEDLLIGGESKLPIDPLEVSQACNGSAGAYRTKVGDTSCAQAYGTSLDLPPECDEELQDVVARFVSRARFLPEGCGLEAGLAVGLSDISGNPSEGEHCDPECRGGEPNSLAALFQLTFVDLLELCRRRGLCTSADGAQLGRGALALLLRTEFRRERVARLAPESEWRSGEAVA